MRRVLPVGLVGALAVVATAGTGISDSGGVAIRTASALPAIAITDPRLVLPAPDLPPELTPRSDSPSSAPPSSEAPSSKAPPPAPTTRPYQTLTITIGGDLGLNPSDQPVVADHVSRHGQRYTFPAITRGLEGYLTADIVLANLETVVTTRNDLPPVAKAFNFRTHPAAVRHLVTTGFNVLTLANNHTFDYGEAGLADTIRHLDAMKADGLKAVPGIGFGRGTAIAAAEVALPQARVRIGAAGIGGGAGLGGERATMASYHGSDFSDVVRNLRDASGDIRILSVHFGQELGVEPTPADQSKLRDALAAGNIDIVAGHHAHVAAGIQEIDGRFIFYGLGNLLHPGMQDMGRYGACRDFGVLATIHFGRAVGEPYSVRAVEVRTLVDMHAGVRVRSGDDGSARVAILNQHAAGLDDRAGPGRGVRFSPQPDGSGLHCTARASDQDDALATRCAAATEPRRPTSAQAASCGRSELVARRSVDSLFNVSARHSPAAAPTVPKPITWRPPSDDR